VPPNAIVVGNPARIVGYADTGEAVQSTRILSASQGDVRVQETRVAGVTLHRLKLVKDMRGSLSVGEYSRDIPFTPQRYFLVFDVPSAEVRGEHAHYECHQFLICAKGRVAVVADDGVRREEYVLDGPEIGVYLPPMVWGIQYRYSADAVLLVFASHAYDPKDYIRKYDDFLAARAGR
jgi:dTDP-4-dehydrorhamnose 3,5-epimerase-like enzyme